jgi:AraC-like DNA-binding protein
VDAFFEGRSSDSPCVDLIWHGYFNERYAPICPADERWNMLFTRRGRSVEVTVEGPTTRAVTKVDRPACEFLVIQFKVGTWIPRVPAGRYIDTDVALPGAAKSSFCLDGSTLQVPDYDNVETFVERLVRRGLLVRDPAVEAALREQPIAFSDRTMRRRFLQATGLRRGTIRVIERARRAGRLLEQGLAPADAAFEAGYSDQPHMTRELKRCLGRTPAELARLRNVPDLAVSFKTTDIRAEQI